jgi:hypothetical protein
MDYIYYRQKSAPVYGTLVSIAWADKRKKEKSPRLKRKQKRERRIIFT